MHIPPCPGTILVVDDEPGNLRLLTVMLGKYGYEVRTVINGEMALKSVALAAPDLILLDINMPGMDGYEVCRQLKLQEAFRAIPVIFISAFGEVLDKVRAFSMGGVDYITKPFQLEEVIARVQTHLTMRQAQQQIYEQNKQLQREIYERQRVEAALQRMVDDLEQRNNDMSRLNRLSDLLQRSQSLEEVYSVSVPLLAELFPNQSGVLYMVNGETAQFDIALSWGQACPQSCALTPAMCSGFEGGRIHYVENAQHALQCQVPSSTSAYPYLCVQLITRDELLGLLYVDNGPVQDDEDRENWLWLASMVADRFALTLSNLRLREQLREQSIRDPLTGLLNRRYLDDMFTRELDRAVRHQHSIGVIMADIDYFKYFNDSYGHIAGDALLRAVGKFLKEHVRREDIVCRYGGEEFVLVLPESSLEETRRRAEGLRSAIKDIELAPGQPPPRAISISFGVAAVPAHGTMAEAVIQAADRALYRAKAAGRDCVMVADIAAAR